MTVLLTGGTGYIGSHVAHLLRDRGDEVVIVDDLVTGARDRVEGFPLVELDLASPDAPRALASTLREHRVDAVVHFAARKQAGESVAEPVRYYRDNLGGLGHLLDAMSAAGVGTLVFSSSAAVYGQGEGRPIGEDAPTIPVNPYGETKLAGEWLVNAWVRAHGEARATSLRYFNVAGAGDPRLGDRMALNLIPMVFERLVARERPRVFGDDYATPDGTCVRDFVHVADLADAHVLALDALRGGAPGARVYNVGTGRGYSVREVIDAIGRATGLEVAAEVLPRRAGDPDSIVADASRIAGELGWRASRGLDDMVSSAWEGYRRNVR